MKCPLVGKNKKNVDTCLANTRNIVAQVVLSIAFGTLVGSGRRGLEHSDSGSGHYTVGCGFSRTCNVLLLVGEVRRGVLVGCG